MKNSIEIQVLDIGFGNIGTWEAFLPYCGYIARPIRQLEQYSAEEVLIVPGVGNFTKAIQAIHHANFAEILKDKSTKILGVCLGFQVFFDGSEESRLPGLKRIPGYFEKLNNTNIGWREVDLIEPEKYFFLHNYALKKQVCNADVRFSNDIIASVKSDNFCGLQFHPERSNRAGIKLVKSAIKELING